MSRGLYKNYSIFNQLPIIIFLYSRIYGKSRAGCKRRKIRGNFRSRKNSRSQDRGNCIHAESENLTILIIYYFNQVRWLGYGESEDTWEPEADIKECASEVVQEYYSRMKVNDKTELMESLQRSISRSNHKLKTKKRKLEESDVDEGSASDSSFTTPKKNSSSKKSQKKRFVLQMFSLKCFLLKK